MFYLPEYQKLINNGSLYQAIRGEMNQSYHLQIAGCAYLIAFAITLDRNSVQLCFCHNGNLGVDIDAELFFYRNET